MTELFTELWTVFTTCITNFAGGIKDAFLNLLYVDPTADSLVVSDFAKFGFIMIGFSLGLGVVRMIIHKIRG